MAPDSRGAPRALHAPGARLQVVPEAPVYPEPACMTSEVGPTGLQKSWSPGNTWQRLLRFWGGGREKKGSVRSRTEDEAKLYGEKGRGKTLPVAHPSMPRLPRPHTAPEYGIPRSVGRTETFGAHLDCGVQHEGNTSALSQSASLPGVRDPGPWVPAPWENWSKSVLEGQAQDLKETRDGESEGEEVREVSGAEQQAESHVKREAKGPRIPLRDVIRRCNKEWYEETAVGAEQGDVAMQLLLGQMLIAGYGTQRSPHVGLKWLERASEKEPEARVVLDAMRAKGTK